MSTVERPERRKLPPLAAGQRLDRATFHERYEAMPPGTWAELVEGVVYMPSPVFIDHGEVDGTVGYWLGHYRRFTPGLSSPRNTSTILGIGSEVQPDLQLRIPEERGGRTKIVDGFIVGPPELIVEVGKSSRSYDLGAKKRDYDRGGVLDYVFVGIDPDEVLWFTRRKTGLKTLRPGADGVFRSPVFPGLWLDPSAVYEEDYDRLIDILDQGLATPEHATFVERLAEAGP